MFVIKSFCIFAEQTSYIMKIEIIEPIHVQLEKDSMGRGLYSHSTDTEIEVELEKYNISFKIFVERIFEMEQGDYFNPPNSTLVDETVHIDSLIVTDLECEKVVLEENDIILLTNKIKENLKYD